MKHFFQNFFILTILGLFTFQNCYSEAISFETANQVAAQKMQLFNSNYRISSEKSFPITAEHEKNLGYVFVLEPKGYIVVSGDSRLRPIIAHSQTSDFGKPSLAENVLFQFLYADLNNQINNPEKVSHEVIKKRECSWQNYLNIRLQKAAADSFEQWPPPGTTSTGGWLKTQLDQVDPYNRFCPLDILALEQEQKEVRVVAGCPSIAITQIMNYFQTINGTRFDDQDDYIDNFYLSQGLQYRIDDDYEKLDFPSFSELNEQLEKVELRLEHGRMLTAVEKAALVFACGVAAKQIYSANISGTLSVQQACDAFLRFGFETARLFTGSTTDSVLYANLSQNMKDGRPALLAVLTPQRDAGHNLVIDGYNTNDEYHLNFGFQGSYDGWYALPDASIPGYNFNVIEGIILDIHELQPTVVRAGQKAKLQDFALANFPNPFNPVTTIEFSIPATQKIRLKIFDIQGREVAELLNEIRSAGVHRVEFNGNILASGVYFCKIMGGNFEINRKMILIK